MKFTVTTPPVGRVVDWDILDAHLRLSGQTLDQAYVHALLDAATEYAEDAMACSLLARTITATFYTGEDIALPRGPLIAITSVTDDNEKAIADYDVSRVGHSDRITINESYELPVTVVYTAGYADAAAVPASIKAAILAHVGTLYERRESVADRSLSVVPHSLADFYQIKSRNVGIG